MRLFKSMFCAGILLVAFVFAGLAQAQDKVTLLTSKNWDPIVKATLNDTMTRFGHTAKDYDPSIRPYAVFDFDNTVSVLDVEEQLAIYQLEHLRFAVKPDKMYEVLTTGIPDVNMDLGKDYGNLTVAKVDAENNLIAIKGAIPGPNGGIVVVRDSVKA